jgi:hypothetical protein
VSEAPATKYDVIETPGGVIYRFHLARRPGLGLLRTGLVLAAIPLALAAGAAVLLVRSAAEIDTPLLAVAWLFVAQMGLVAFIPLHLVLNRRALFRSLAGRFGHHELELNGPWLYWGARLGPFHSRAVSVADLQRFVVYAYDEPDGLDETGAVALRESGALATVEAPGREPFPYIIGWPWTELRALAEDLCRRLAGARLPPVEVVRSTADAVTDLSNRLPAVPVPVPWWARSRWLWLLWHGAGLVGLIAFIRVTTGRAPPWVLGLGVLVLIADVMLIRAGLARKWPPLDLGAGTGTPESGVGTTEK